MRLAQRLTLALVTITLILVAPAIYGLVALRELNQVAYNLSTRDAVSALALGRLQTALSELENAQRIYLALATTNERTTVAQQSVSALTDVDNELRQLREAGYEEPAAEAQAAWEQLRAAIAEEQRLVNEGEVDAADVHREQVVNPAFRQMDLALNPIGEAINEVGREQVAQAQAIAARGSTTTLLALAVALLVALLIGGWMGRDLLRPVRELQRGMASVAGGEFEQPLSISTNRSDEIGDLARSFSLMAEDLAALDKMKAEFVSVASHELKTPLSVIRGYVSLLRDDVYGPVPPEQKKVLGSVSDQTDRLGRLIQQLLDISRFEAGGSHRLDIRPVNLRAFLDDLAASFEALAIQNEIKFNVEPTADLPEKISADSDRLNELVGNLLSNAFKFTARGGRIMLRAGPEQDEVPGVGIDVEDTGVGIPADQLPRIFEKFFQVENEAQPLSVGTGLGLAIAKQIAEAHGGTIGAESTPGEGTTFHVFLPLQPPRSAGGD